MLHEPNALWSLLSQSLTFQTEAFEAVQTQMGYRLAWLGFLVGALSRALGEAGVLMINRVGRWGFLRSIVGSAAALTVSALIWAACIWLALQLLLGRRADYLDVQALVLISYAPLVFSFLSIVPHLGLLWNSLLKVWMLAITIAGLLGTFALTGTQAVFCAGLGWLAFYLLTAVFGSQAEELKLRLLGQQEWLKPKQAAVALLEQEMSRLRGPR